MHCRESVAIEIFSWLVFIDLAGFPFAKCSDRKTVSSDPPAAGAASEWRVTRNSDRARLLQFFVFAAIWLIGTRKIPPYFLTIRTGRG